MARRRRTSPPPSPLRRALDSDFARPVAALFGLGMLWVAFKVGLIGLLANTIVGSLAPKGPTNAGVIYREQMAKHAAENAAK